MSRLNQQLIRKADMVIGDLASGGRLNPEQANAFFRKLIAQPTIIRISRTVPMTAPEREINKIGFGTRILRPGVSATPLAAVDRAKPDLSKILITSKEVIAEVRIPYDVLEDNIEGDNFSNTVMDLMAERSALDLEELIFRGDTASGDLYLKLFDGIAKLAIQNPFAAGAAPSTRDVFKGMIINMPDQYLRNRSAMRFFTTVDQETNYRDETADRLTGLGDATIMGTAPVFGYGVPLEPCAMCPLSTMFLMDPKNVIIGYHRQVRVETDRDITARVWIIVLTMRVGFNFEEVDAVVKATAVP